MNNPYGPWATQMEPGAIPRLSAFWRRRMTRLAELPRGNRAMTPSTALALLLAAAVIGAMPTLEARVVSAEPAGRVAGGLTLSVVPVEGQPGSTGAGDSAGKADGKRIGVSVEWLELDCTKCPDLLARFQPAKNRVGMAERHDAKFADLEKKAAKRVLVRHVEWMEPGTKAKHSTQIGDTTVDLELTVRMAGSGGYDVGINFARKEGAELPATITPGDQLTPAQRKGIEKVQSSTGFRLLPGESCVVGGLAQRDRTKGDAGLTMLVLIVGVDKPGEVKPVGPTTAAEKNSAGMAEQSPTAGGTASLAARIPPGVFALPGYAMLGGHMVRKDLGISDAQEEKLHAISVAYLTRSEKLAKELNGLSPRERQAKMAACRRPRRRGKRTWDFGFRHWSLVIPFHAKSPLPGRACTGGAP